MKFWDFSWEEVGKYDAPAVIDYILKLTKYEKVAYIAHSMGNNELFYAMSEKMEYF
jgi:esterase/lipase superfamily enzyme